MKRPSEFEVGPIRKFIFAVDEYRAKVRFTTMHEGFENDAEENVILEVTLRASDPSYAELQQAALDRALELMARAIASCEGKTARSLAAETMASQEAYTKSLSTDFSDDEDS